MIEGTGNEDGVLVVTPRRGALLAGQDNTLEVLIQVRAPDTSPSDDASRPPLGIALVLDRSASMAGSALREAKRCCEYVAGRLRPIDRLSLVQFDGGVDVLWPAAQTSGRARLQSVIDGIEYGAGTNLHGGWLAGAEQIAPFAGGRGVQRVILLSDGEANRGVTNRHDIARQCGELALAGVTTSTYGVGRFFNESLMVSMAEAGHGNSYYGATAEDLFEPFNRELDLLSNLWMRSAILKVGPAPGVEVEMLNEYSGSPTQYRWRLPEIGMGAEAWALLRLRVPRERLGQDIMSLLKLRVEGVSRDGVSRTLSGRLQDLAVLPAAAYSAVAENPQVLERAEEIEASHLLRHCRSAAMVGAWHVVDTTLAQAAVRFASSPWVSGIMDSMKSIASRRDREVSSKDMFYTSRSLSRRLRSTRELTSLDREADSSSYMRRRTSEGTGEFIKPEEGDGPLDWSSSDG